MLLLGNYAKMELEHQLDIQLLFPQRRRLNCGVKEFWDSSLPGHC